MEGTFAVAPQFQGVLVIHPSPPLLPPPPPRISVIFRLGWELVWYPLESIFVRKKKLHYIFMQKIIFSGKMRKNLFIYVNTVSTELKDILG